MEKLFILNVLLNVIMERSHCPCQDHWMKYQERDEKQHDEKADHPLPTSSLKTAFHHCNELM